MLVTLLIMTLIRSWSF
ncbi:hypothetical protein Goshw_012393 [Gossypium schwendimanii]|uniref:Uncharacterized protein n=1 Tax=Gossypium schwendimanii TaxID=34291 RepID=A0A7J9LVH9_GOSSC|nr:hypothetical protein [Gossypium schwendimanii]